MDEDQEIRASMKARLEAKRWHVYDRGVHRFPSGGRPPCPGCLAMHLLGVYEQREYAAIAEHALEVPAT